MSKKATTKNNNAKNPVRVWLGVALIAFGVLAVYSGISSILDNKQRLITPNTILTVGVADDDMERIQGLSNRTSLGDKEGMLFIYDEVQVGETCYWMKDMNFAIDIAFMNSDKEVTVVYDNVSPETYNNESPELSERFCANDIQYVLELNASKATEYEVSPGAKLKF